MTNDSKNNVYDLEDRTFSFALRVRALIKKLPRNVNNFEDGKQLTRSSGSVGANYIEANDSLGDKDKLMKIRICRKESKESKYWLRLLDIEDNAILEKQRIEKLEKEKEEKGKPVQGDNWRRHR